MSDGLFISFEGVDGAGKSTQTQRAHDYLQARGLRSLVTREPGGTPAGLAIRELVLHGMASFPSLAVTGGTDVVDSTDDLAPRTEALLYAADRAEHVAQVVRPALDRGDIVLCDRYLDSSVAYQAGGRELSTDVIRRLSLWASDGLLPTRTYLLDADPTQSKLRLDHEPDRLESAGDDFQQNVREAFLHLADQEPDRFVVIDASQHVEEVWQQIQDDLDGLVAGRTPDPLDQDAGSDDSSYAEDNADERMKADESDPDLDDWDEDEDFDENDVGDMDDADADSDEEADGLVEDAYQDGDDESDPDYADEDDDLDDIEDSDEDDQDEDAADSAVGDEDDDQSSSAAMRSHRLFRTRFLRKAR